ncbi:MAG: RNA polymerase sigma factor [Aestuariivirga sp.]
MSLAPVLTSIDRGRLLALLIKELRDFALAEDALQEAYVSALDHWPRGIPANPQAWLLQVARRKAIDKIRRASNWRSKRGELEYLVKLDQDAPELRENGAIPDERLRLIFTCCHPALDKQASVALTLRTLCGLTTEEIARAFVVPREAMAQRLVRVQRKIAKAGIPYEVPEQSQWPDRIEAVLTVIYLIFNEGYASSSRDYMRADLCAEAIRLAELLCGFLPGEPEPTGLLALMLLHRARFDTRTGADGVPVALEDQDRSRWGRARIANATAMLERALRLGRPGAYQLQAAIAAIHCEAKSFAETGWREIVLIYDRLLEITPNPVITLNRIVALSYAEGAAPALAALAAIEQDLQAYQPFHAAKADLLSRAWRTTEAAEAYRRAISISSSPAEKQFLERRLKALTLVRTA